MTLSPAQRAARGKGARTRWQRRVDALGLEGARKELWENGLGKSPGRLTREEDLRRALADEERSRQGREARKDRPHAPAPADSNISPTTTQVLSFVSKFIRRNRYAPTYREITEGCELSSNSVTEYHLRILEERGTLRRIPAIARGLVLTGGVGPRKRESRTRDEEP